MNRSVDDLSDDHVRHLASIEVPIRTRMDDLLPNAILLAREVARSRPEIARRRAVEAELRALHAPFLDVDGEKDCFHCRHRWPCPTVCILNGEHHG